MTLCVFCDANRDAILGATESALPICSVCYGKVIDKGVVWEATTSKGEILKGIRSGGPRFLDPK